MGKLSLRDMKWLAHDHTGSEAEFGSKPRLPDFRFHTVLLSPVWGAWEALWLSLTIWLPLLPWRISSLPVVCPHPRLAQLPPSVPGLTVICPGTSFPRDSEISPQWKWNDHSEFVSAGLR